MKRLEVGEGSTMQTTLASTVQTTLDGRRVLVTGAGMGIGREVAISAARAGADVIAFSLAGDLEGLGDEIRALGRRYVARFGDVTNAADIAAVVAAAEHELGGIDILV